MNIEGSFGYKIGRKIRLFHVTHNADILWQTCVRELYVLLKHYGNIDDLKKNMKNLKIPKKMPNERDIEKLKLYMDEKIEIYDTSSMEWDALLKHCQHSFINAIQSGYFLNNGKDMGYVFIVDFNKEWIKFYYKKSDGKVIPYNEVTLTEIMNFDEMPTASLHDIHLQTQTQFDIYYQKRVYIEKEIQKIKNIIDKTIEMGGEQNIIQKAKTMLEKMEWEKNKILLGYKVFYNRLNMLNLIEQNEINENP